MSQGFYRTQTPKFNDFHLDLHHLTPQAKINSVSSLGTGTRSLTEKQQDLDI